MYIGNDAARRQVHEYLTHSTSPSLLLVGPGGHGKTHLARWAAGTIDKSFIEINGNVPQDHNDLYAFLKVFEMGPGALIIDEIHALKPRLQEALYEAMVSRIFQVIAGRGLQKRVRKIRLHPFAMFGTTTKESQLLRPFRQRFHIIRLQPYGYDEIVKILQHHFQNSRDVDAQVPFILAQYSRNTPRVAVQLSEYFIRTGRKTPEHAYDLVIMRGLAPQGLTREEVRLLRALTDGTLSLQSLASRLMISEEDVLEIHEPYPLKLGFIEKTNHGRTLTPQGRAYLSTPEHKVSPQYERRPEDGALAIVPITVN